jgi:hypothetical protein
MEGGIVDWEVILPIAFLLLVPAGLVCGGLALYQYLRFENSIDVPHVPVAMTIFVVQYGLVGLLLLAYSQRYRLLPTILMFLTAISLVAVARLGWQAHTRAGHRIALAGLSTLCAYICFFIHDYQEYAEFRHW